MSSQGLLDVGVSKMMNGRLNNYLKQVDLSWYQNLPEFYVNKLKQRNMQVVVYPQQINSKQTNYAELAQQTNSSKLLVIKLAEFGVKRAYNGFIPIGAPEAYCVLTGELVDTATNQVLWRHQATFSQSIRTPWDQAPNYPHLTHAIKMAAHNAQQELADSFFGNY